MASGTVRELGLSPQLECVWQFYLPPWGRGLGGRRSVRAPAGCSLLVPRPRVPASLACTRDKGAEVRSRSGGRCLLGRPGPLGPRTRHTCAEALPAAPSAVPRRVLRFITKVAIKATWVRANIRGGKTKEIKCKAHCWCRPHGARLSRRQSRWGGGGFPRSRNQRTPAQDACSLAPLLFEKQLPFNLFLSFISQVSQHGAV